MTRRIEGPYGRLFLFWGSSIYIYNEISFAQRPPSIHGRQVYQRLAWSYAGHSGQCSNTFRCRHSSPSSFYHPSEYPSFCWQRGLVHFDCLSKDPSLNVCCVWLTLPNRCFPFVLLSALLSVSSHWHIVAELVLKYSVGQEVTAKGSMNIPSQLILFKQVRIFSSYCHKT